MNIRNLAAVMLCGLAMGVMVSCGGNDRLFDSVPADAAGVVTINTRELMKSLDGVAYGGRLTADETLDRFLSHASEPTKVQLKALLASDAVDRGVIAGFAVKGAGASVVEMMKRGEYVYTFAVADEKKLLSQLGCSAAESLEGYDAYALDGATLFVKGRQGWIMSGNPADNVRVLDEQLQRAANTSVLSLKGVGRYLDENDDIMRVAVSTDLAGDKGWTCASLEVAEHGRALEIEGKYIDINGKEPAMDKYLKSIDLDLLDYTMPSDVFVMAVGLRPDTDWDGLMQYVQALQPLDYRQRALIGMIVPYLKRIDGTLMVAAGPTLEERLTKADFSNDINFIVAVQMKKSEVAKTMSDFGDLLSMLGAPMVKRGDEYVIQVPGMAPVILRTVDGNCIVLTNRPLQQLGNDAARKAMKGNGLALWANIPDSVGEAVYGGRGFNLTAGLDDDFEVKFMFNGQAAPIMEQFAMIMSPDNAGGDGVSSSADDLGFTPVDTIQ